MPSPGTSGSTGRAASDNPDEFVLLEAFRDGEAGAEHVKTAHFKTALKEQPAMLAKIPDIINVEIPGTEWSKLAEMSVPG